jgi:hypothetical protein
VFQQTRRTIALLGGAIGMSLVLGVAAAAGVSSQSEKPDSTQAGGSASTTTAPPPPDTQLAAETTDTTAPPAPAEAASTPPPTSAPEAPAAEAAPQESGAAPVEPESTVVARRNPSRADVLAAMRALQASIPMLPATDEAAGREVGDRVCTAFDQGNAYQTVVDGVVSAAKGHINQSQARTVVSSAVGLFCPGHQGKLG